MGIDKSLLSGGAGLVKSHRVDDSGETTVMRSIEEIKQLDEILTQDDVGCDTNVKRALYGNVFGLQTVRRNYRC